MHRNTEREAAALEALKQIESNPQMRELLGVPVTIEGRFSIAMLAWDLQTILRDQP